MEECQYSDAYGRCMAQKNMPKCDYNLHDDCIKYKPITKGITIDIKASLNWEKICRYIIFTYNLNEEEISNYLKNHISDYVNINFNT